MVVGCVTDAAAACGTTIHTAAELRRRSSTCRSRRMRVLPSSRSRRAVDGRAPRPSLRRQHRGARREHRGARHGGARVAEVAQRTSDASGEGHLVRQRNGVGGDGRRTHTLHLVRREGTLEPPAPINAQEPSVQQHLPWPPSHSACTFRVRCARSTCPRVRRRHVSYPGARRRGVRTAARGRRPPAVRRD